MFKPCAVSYRKPCTKDRSRSLADVLLENRQLQSSVSSEDHYAWDLVEVAVEIACSNKCFEVLTQQQLSHVQSTSQIPDDLPKHSPHEDNCDITFS